MKIYTTGVFDILHRGHLNILTQAAALGDLTVGIMTDRGIEETKGRRPILSLEERDAQIRSLPWVSEVLHYTSTDQRPNYRALEPDIVVQGDDWLHSADRSDALDYLRENTIRLVLLPRTEGISTSEIRKRVQRSERRDESFLRDHVRLPELDELRLFEQYADEKVERLVEKISRDGVFLNPISIVEELIVIDGVNRLEAVRRLGGRRIPCVVYNYADVDLLANVHFKKDGKITRLSEFAREEGERIEFPRRSTSDIIAAVEAGELIPNGEDLPPGAAKRDPSPRPADGPDRRGAVRSHRVRGTAGRSGPDSLLPIRSLRLRRVVATRSCA